MKYKRIVIKIGTSLITQDNGNLNTDFMSGLAEICKKLIESKSSKELDFINEQILQRKPDSEDRLNYFNEIRNKIDPSRSDITTWVDLLDLEEGRLSSKPS